MNALQLLFDQHHLPELSHIGMRGVPTSEKHRGVMKVTLLHTADLLCTAIYHHLAVSAVSTLFNKVDCVKWRYIYYCQAFLYTAHP